MESAEDTAVWTEWCETGHGPGRALMSGPENGRVVVLLHGYGASADQWRLLLPWLAGRYRVCAPDLLGFAEAPTPRGPYTTARWTAQVRMLLDALCIERATLVGHSLGGLVALTAAQALPERVERLALIDALGLGMPDLDRLLRGVSGWFIRSLRAPGVGEALFWLLRGQRRLAHSLAVGAYHEPDRAPDDALAVWLDLIHRPRAHRAYLDIIRRLEEHRVSLRPGELDLPALIVWGAEDRGLPVRLAVDFGHLLPHAGLHIIPNCGHVPHVEQTAATATALLNFLSATD